MSNRRARAASYESDSEESSDDDPSRRRSVKSSVLAVQKKSSRRRTPSGSPSDEDSDESSSSSSSSSSDEDDSDDDGAPTPESDKHRHSNRDHHGDSRKRRHDTDSEEESPKKSKHTSNRDSSRSKNSDKDRTRHDEYDRHSKSHNGRDHDKYEDRREERYARHNGRDSGRRGSDRDRQRSRDRQDDRRDKELERRRKDRERRHRRQREEDQQRHRDEEKENRDISERSQRNKDQQDHSSTKKSPEGNTQGDEDFLAAKRAKSGGDEALTTRTGGAYIPPARLRMMQAQITDKASAQFQRIAWEALKKSINGLINKVNVSNMIEIVRELFQENLVRGRGLIAKSVISAQVASPTFTHVYAALVAIINTKFPQIGELILKRLSLQFKKGYRRNDKTLCLSSVRFLAHLVNQQVAHEIIALEILTLLLENPTDDSVEITVGFLKECGAKLTEVSPRGINAIFERLRSVLHEGSVNNRTQYMMEVMFQVRKDGFKENPAVIEELDLVEEEDQFTHMLTLEDAVSSEDILNVFKLDEDYEQNEEKYKVLKKEILDEGSSDDESGSDSDSSEDDSDDEGEGATTTIIDQTETNMVAFRRTIYLTIQSSLDYEECAHKLLKTDIKPGMEDELCNMILDCCAQQRTYEKFFGLLAQRFCMIDKKYIEPCQKIFKDQYETCHRLETNKLRNVAKFFAHLLHTDAISWEVVQFIHLNEDETTSSSRIFIKILFQELSEYMGLPKLHDRLQDQTLSVYFEGLFPRDNPRNTRFAINFFTSIGLGGLTDELRAHLKTMPRPAPKPIPEDEDSSSSSSGSSSSSSDSSSESSSDSDSSSSSSEDSDSEDDRRKKSSRKQPKSKVESKVKVVTERDRHQPREDAEDSERRRKEERRRELQRECQRLEELCMKARRRKKTRAGSEGEPDDEHRDEERRRRRDLDESHDRGKERSDGRTKEHRSRDDRDDRNWDRESRRAQNGERDLYERDYREKERNRDRDKRPRAREERTRDRRR